MQDELEHWTSNSNSNNYFNFIQLEECSLGSACDQQELIDCRCCQAGCPPSPISLQKCLECTPNNNNNNLNNNNLNNNNNNLNKNWFTSSDEHRLVLSPSLASTGLSLNETIDDFSLNQQPTPSTSYHPPNSPTDQDIVWINKELEELIKCCCCDQPTQSETLPIHHADAHPTHHVNFDMLFSPPLNFPYKPTFEDHQTPSISTTTNQFNQQERIDHHPVNSFRCQWKDCNLEFSDQLKLTEHVNLTHLFQSTYANYNSTSIQPSQNCSSKSYSQQPINLPSSPSLLPLNRFLNNQLLLDPQSNSPSSTSFTQPTIETSRAFADPINATLSPNPSTLLSKSSCESIFDFFQNPPSAIYHTSEQNNPATTAADHHLRPLQNSFLDPHRSPSLASMIDPSGGAQPAHNPLEPTVNTTTTTTTTTTIIPTAATAASSSSTSTATEQHHCRWESCTGKSFSSTAELTEHLSSEHVGSGKSSYVCMWEDCYCERKRVVRGEGCAEGVSGGAAEAAGAATGGVEKGARRERKVFNQRQKIVRHLQSHTGDRPFGCGVCGKKFGEMATLVQHGRTHTHEKPYVCQVAGCAKAFALQSALTIHTRTHTGLKPFKCPVPGCSSHFAESSNLSKHLKTHNALKSFVCPACQRPFTRSDQLQRHLKSHHSSPGPLKRPALHPLSPPKPKKKSV